MSRLIWKNLLLPDLNLPATDLQDSNYGAEVKNVRPLAEASDKIMIPDPRAFRSMSRASVFLSHVCTGASEVMGTFLKESPFAIGIYCAVENGPIDAPSTKKILQQNQPEQFAEFYRKFRNPKMYLKQLPNLAPAQMGISMQIQGPMNVYTHSTSGSLHALEQAEWDLRSKLVQGALVCTAHAFDDFLVVARERHADTQKIGRSRCLTEGAGAAFFVGDENFTEWPKKVTTDPENFFGISDQILNLIRNV